VTGESASTHRRTLPLAGNGRSALGLLLVLAAVLACFPKVASSQWVFFARDIHGYWHPMVATFVRVVGEGSLPLWDPYEGYGLPLWADPGAQVAYPLTWLNLLLLPDTVYKLLVLGHLVAGGAGVFALARRWRLGVLPATAAAVAFACSGPLVSAGSLIHHLCGAAWIPWVLWAFEGVLETGSRRAVAQLALLGGGQALAGSAEMCAMSALAVALRWLALASSHWGRSIRRAAPLVAAAGVAALLGAAQWLPTASLVGRTNRMHFAPDSNLFWSTHPATLVDVIVPRLISEMSMGPGVREVLYGGREPFLASLYLGACTLPLVLMALRSERRERRFALASLAFFLALACAQYVPPARAVLSLPPLSLFRYPSKYLLPAALSWALLAGLGAEVWSRAWSRRDRVFGRAVAVALLALGLALAFAAHRLTLDPGPLVETFDVAEPWRAWMAVLASRKLQTSAAWLASVGVLLLVRAWRPAWGRMSAAAATLLVALDLVQAARPVNTLAPASLLAHRPPLLDHLLPDAERTRLLSVGGALASLNQELVRGPAGWEPEWRFALGAQEMIEPPTGSRWGLRGSYDADFTGLASATLPFMSVLVRQTEETPLSVRLLEMGNVGWVIDPAPGGFPRLPEAARSLSVFARPLRLLRVPNPLPPCYVVGAATRADSDEAAVRRIAAFEFDPVREVVLAGGAPLRAAPGFQGTARYLLRHANRLRIEVETNGPGVLVLSEAFDVDWRATVDGVPVTVERANVLFRGVRVPAGRHRVELTYLPRSVPWGIGLTALGLALAAVLLRR
jgi:hypothetical protein